MANYVERGGDPAAAPPFTGAGMDMQVHSIPCADPAALDTWCNHVLNRSWGKRRYWPFPLGPGPRSLLITCGRLQEQRCATLPGSQAGFTRETHVGIWIHVLVHEKTFWGTWTPVRHALVPAYFFVDGGVPIISGREVYGIPKQVGVFTPAAQGPITKVQAEVITTLAPTSLLGLAEVLRLEPATSVPVPTAQSIAAGAMLPLFVQAIFGQGAIPTVTVPAPLLQWLALFQANTTTWACLKQFRDAVLPGKAAVQEILEVDVTATSAAFTLLTAPQELVVTHRQSHPILSELGLVAQGDLPAPGGEVRIPVASTMQAAFDFGLPVATRRDRNNGNYFVRLLRALFGLPGG